METFGAVIGSFGFLALIISAVMFIPVPAFKARRSLAKRLAIGGGIAFVLGLIATPTPKAGTSKTTTSSAPSKPETTPAPTAVATKRDDAATKTEFVELFHRVIGTAKPCDEAVSALGKAANTGNQYTTYQVAKEGSDACQAATASLNDMTAPDNLSSANTEAVDKALKICRGAYMFRQMGMAEAMEIADGNSRPSKVSEMAEHLKDGQTGTVLCVAEMFYAANKIGVDLKRLN